MHRPPARVARLPSIEDLHQDYLAGNSTPVEVVQARIERIRQYEHELHAWVAVFEEEALAEATRQTEILASASVLPPLFGVTLGVKDIIDVRGHPTCQGVPHRPAQPAKADAPIVNILRTAGAIILGKTVTTPYACFDRPPTCNPWNLSHTPGGSSSGSAAAVAAGMVDIALATQTGGSIIRPASFCGIAGWKPAWGIWPMQSIAPVSELLDHVGILSNHVTDLERVHQVVVGSQREDRSPNSNDDVLADPLRQVIVSDFLDDDAQRSVMRRFQEVAGQSCERLQCEGELELPFDLEEALRIHRTIMCHDLARHHDDAQQRSPDWYPQGVTSMIAEGRQVESDRYRRAKDRQVALRQQVHHWLTHRRVAAAPASMGSAPPSRSTTGDPRYNSLFSLTGVPVITLPFAVDDNGMPWGIQMASHPEDATDLFRVSRSISNRLADFISE